MNGEVQNHPNDDLLAVGMDALWNTGNGLQTSDDIEKLMEQGSLTYRPVMPLLKGKPIEYNVTVVTQDEGELNRRLIYGQGVTEKNITLRELDGLQLIFNGDPRRTLSLARRHVSITTSLQDFSQALVINLFRFRALGHY